MRKLFATLVLLIGGAALMANSVHAASEGSTGFEDGTKLMNAKISKQLRTRAANLGVSATPTPNDTVWVGFVDPTAVPAVTNYWNVGGMLGEPGGFANHPYYNTSGLWTFENDQITKTHGDSLLGWWPVRSPHRNASGATLVDEDRPWWTIELGNQANFVINQGAAHKRTFGVIGVWHRDPGGNGLAVGSPLPGTNPVQPNWTPLNDSFSAWMGLRSHGDVTVGDPITGNAFNATVLDYNQRQGALTIVNSRSFPGYGSQMDQILYKDIDMTGVAANTPVNVKFNYQTRMSTAKDAVDKTRTGWHLWDMLSENQVTTNFISAEAGTPANTDAPLDSFEVYMGAPAEGTFLTSLGTTEAIYDAQRRWMGEVVQRNHARWLMGVAGDNNGTGVVLTLSGADADDFRAAGGGKIRLAFRVHTNRGFDDEGPSYSSGGKGAAQVDNVEVDANNDATYELTGAWGDFEAAGSIDNDTGVAATAAWKSTGKPPAIYFHTEDVAGLPYQDLCGAVGSPNRICNLDGTVISAGIHEENEAASSALIPTEREGEWGIISPTVNLMALSKVKNGWNLTLEEASPTDDYYTWYEMYAGIFDVFATGAIWQFGFQSYPAAQALDPAKPFEPVGGQQAWGEVCLPGFLYFNPDIQCFQVIDGANTNGLIKTSNPSGQPDSLRLFLQKLNQCYRFGITTGCGPTDGCYFDNMALAIVDGTPAAIGIEIWNWLNDSFPATETPGLPGTAAFDTTSALIKIGLNQAQTDGTLNRPTVPGDSLWCSAVGDSVRMDLAFRIRPGVGNYVTIGNPASGLRQLPTGLTAATSGDGSFWGSYMASPGLYASSGAVAAHAAAPSGWSSLVWNTARIDTVFGNLFPVQGQGIGNPNTGGQWAGTYHEDEVGVFGGSPGPRNSLGIARNRCFMIDETGGAVAANITCGSGTFPPVWVTNNPSGVGYNGQTQTYQGTKVVPDGLLTPGAHVQYFLRRHDLGDPDPNQFAMAPDTGRVSPQNLEGSSDGHRWQEFSVLPDRWKDPAFNQGGLGMACMLYVDLNDRRGNERVWKAVSDSIGATSALARGASDGYGGVPGGTSVNDPTYFIANKNASAGSTWDMYGTKASESLTTGAASIGGRLGFIPVFPNLAEGKTTKNPPTLDMLEAYYKVLLILTGDLNSGILGPFADRSSDDTGMLQLFLNGATPSAKRGIMIEGDGFAEFCDGTGAGSPQFTFMTNYMGATLVAPGYLTASGNSAATVDLITKTSINAAGDIYGINNTCLQTLDILAVNTGLLEATVASEYAPGGGAYVSGVVKPSAVARPWIALLDGWDIENLRSRFGNSTVGRVAYFYYTLNQLFGAICPLTGAPSVTLDVPNNGNGSQFVNFAKVLGNPVVNGSALIQLSIAKKDFVEIKVFDVAGRQIRLVASRQFEAGLNPVTWDGRDDHGKQVPRGVYFARISSRANNFENLNKIVVLN